MKRINLIIITILSFFLVNNVYALYENSSSINNTFKTEKYNFTIKTNYGEYIDTKLTIKDNEVILPIPVLKGYSFNGYMIESNYIDYDLDSLNNKEIEASWELETYDINIDLKGGTISDYKTNYTIEDEVSIPNPTKEHYMFIGWITNENMTPTTNYVIKKGTTGEIALKAIWSSDKYYKVSTSSKIQNVAYKDGKSGFLYSVWIDDVQVASSVLHYENDYVKEGSKVKIKALKVTGYNVKSDLLEIESLSNDYEYTGIWYDDIAPTITKFTVTNLGYYDSSNPSKGWNVKVVVSGYDYGVGISKYQTWLVPYGNGTGASRVDGATRTMTNVLYLNTTSGRTFCAYVIDKAGNESSKCSTIKV